MEFVVNDGGRAEAGYKGGAGDCVARSIAIVTGRPYREVYDRLAEGTGNQRAGKRGKRARSARNGINTKRKWFKDYMAELGFGWVPTMQIGQGCKVHLCSEELPAGKLVVAVSKHYTAVIDGVLHDTYDCSASRGATIYPYGHPDIPKGAVELENGNGFAYDPKRCVYGYWKLNDPR